MSVNIFEFSFYQNQNKTKCKPIPIRVSQTNSDRVVEFLLYKNHYVSIKKLHIFLGNQNCK